MDPQQQQAANLLAGLGVGAVVFGALFFFAIVAFLVFLFWRVFSKAGFPGALGLIVLVPGFGWIIAMCILAFGQWRVAPVASTYVSGPPSYPPPAYPPANYPSAGPPSQL